MTTLVDGTTNGAVLSDPEVTVVLETLARHFGNFEATAQELEEHGIDLAPGTIKYWAREKHKDRYKQARQMVAEQGKEVLADAHHSAATSALQLEAETDEELQRKLGEGKLTPKELVALKKGAAVSSGIHTEKGQLLSGEATHRVERSPDEIQRALQKLGAKIEWDFDGEASEEPVPELPAASTD